jgi:hypothetical protein
MRASTGVPDPRLLRLYLAILLSICISGCAQSSYVSSPVASPSPSPLASPTPSLVAQLPNPCSMLTSAQVAVALGTPATVGGTAPIGGLAWMGGTRCLWRGSGVSKCAGGACILEDDLKLDQSIDAAHIDFQTIVVAADQAFGCTASPLTGLGDEAETCTPTKEVVLPGEVVLLARKANVLFACALVAPSSSNISDRALTAAQVISAAL